MRTCAAILRGVGEALAKRLRLLTPWRLLGVFVLAGIVAALLQTRGDYQDAVAASGTEDRNFVGIEILWWSLVGRAAAVVFASGALVLSFFAGRSRNGMERPGTTVAMLLLMALAMLLSWVPGDLASTRRAFEGMSLAGEPTAVGAYVGKVVLLAVLNLSIPVAALVYYRLSMMDRYVLRAFLTPFGLAMFGFFGIWAIFDYTDNGPAFAGLPLGQLAEFYAVQIPYIVLFVAPVAVLLSALFAFSGLSRSNELISMIGAGRSVTRIVAPVIAAGFFLSIACLAFKYEWAPRSIGAKEAILDTARRQQIVAKRKASQRRKAVWAERGWMHMNDVGRRGWFVGKVPLELSRPMEDLLVWQLSEEGTLQTVWKAKRARWLFDADPPVWTLQNATVYQFDERGVPTIESQRRLQIDQWNETPWSVLSSSQNPEHLGIPGLARYLQAHSDLDKESLAPFRTNWWYVFAEPFGCLAMILVAAPLGIVYSRRGAMAGVTGAILLFALMYLMRGTFLAMGQASLLPPFFAAWGTNLVIGGVGLVLLWFRAQNREVPTVTGAVRRALPTS